MKKKSIQISKTIESFKNPEIQLGRLVRTADVKRVFSKGDSTNWSYKLFCDTIPTYRIDYLPERYNENLLLPKKLSQEQNNQIVKELNLVQYYIK